MAKISRPTSLMLVVARYNENLTWLKNIGHNYIVYNKGEKLKIPCVELPNIGREAHTFLYHVVANYDNLSEYTVFLQGNPHEHCDKIDEYLKNFPDSIDKLHKYCDGCYGLAHRYLDETVEELHKIYVYPDLIYNEFFDLEWNKFHFACGAQYLVHKDNIRNKSWQFYFDLLNHCPWDYHEPWSIERLWPQIFDKTDKYKHKIKNLGK